MLDKYVQRFRLRKAIFEDDTPLGFSFRDGKIDIRLDVWGRIPCQNIQKPSHKYIKHTNVEISQILIMFKLPDITIIILITKIYETNGMYIIKHQNTDMKTCFLL